MAGRRVVTFLRSVMVALVIFSASGCALGSTAQPVGTPDAVISWQAGLPDSIPAGQASPELCPTAFWLPPDKVMIVTYGEWPRLPERVAAIGVKVVVHTEEFRPGGVAALYLGYFTSIVPLPADLPPGDTLLVVVDGKKVSLATAGRTATGSP